ncbi:MAG: urease subunit alpha, partial [Verrucomicrobiota bacterium]
EMVVKGGVIAWSQMGDANASIPTPQPVWMRKMFGGYGRVPGRSGVSFVSALSLEEGGLLEAGLSKRLEAVRGCRLIGKRDMIWNQSQPQITVDPETYEVRADGELLVCEPARWLPLAQCYSLF